jgi:hypothetical protein
VSFRSAGLNASCTISGLTVIESVSTTCPVYSSSCGVEFGYLEVLGPSGGAFYNDVQAHTRVTVTNSSGNPPLTWGTPYE